MKDTFFREALPSRNGRRYNLSCVASFGLLLLGALAAQGKTLGYVTNSADNTVTVFDPASNAVGRPIAVGQCPGAIVASPDGKRVYVADQCIGAVSVIDTSRNLQIATIAVGSNPSRLTITPNGRFLYIVNYLGRFQVFNDTITIIDTRTGKIVTTISLNLTVNGIAAAPDGKHIYVAYESYAGDYIGAIDTTTHVLGPALVAVGSFYYTVIQEMAITPNGSKLYLPAYHWRGIDSTIVVDTATWKVVASVPINKGPGVWLAFITRVAISPDGAQAYATFNMVPGGTPNFSSEGVIDTKTDTLGKTILLPSSGSGAIAFRPDGDFAYVLSVVSNSITVIDTRKKAVVGSIKTGNKPQGIAFAKVRGEDGRNDNEAANLEAGE